MNDHGPHLPRAFPASHPSADPEQLRCLPQHEACPRSPLCRSNAGLQRLTRRLGYTGH